MGDAFGYIRVSSREQNEDRQMIALMEAAIPVENIFMDKQSGKDFNRPMYQQMLQTVKRNDMLYIKSIDRLGRNYEEILEQWRILCKVKGVDIIVLDMPILDTRFGKDLIGTFLCDVVLQLLSFVAENERDNIRLRQAEGIAAAKARGVEFGRPKVPIPENFESVILDVNRQMISAEEAAKQCGMSRATFYRRMREYRILYEKMMQT